MKLSVEVRGRQRARNMTMGVASVLLLVTLLAASSRTWAPSPSAAACLRARQVTQAAGVATIVALLLLGLRALELVLLPRHSDTVGLRRWERWAGPVGALGLIAGAVATIGVALTVADTVRHPPGAAACSGPALGTGAGASMFAVGQLTLLVLVCGFAVGSVADLPAGDESRPNPWRRRLPEPGKAPDGTVICCSGEGIRAAAFCLGGLQALDSTPAPASAAEETEGADADSTGKPVPSIYAAAQTVIGVSGGGYMAAAWHVARHPKRFRPRPGRGPRFRGRVPGHGEGGGRGTALAGPAADGVSSGTVGRREETLALDADPALRPFGAASPELRRLRSSTTYLASSNRVRADALLSWFLGTALVWSIALAGIALTAWVLSLFVDHLDLARGLETPDASLWPARPFAAIALAFIAVSSPVPFFAWRLLQMRRRSGARAELPVAIQNTVVPVIATVTSVTALLFGVSTAAVLLHDASVANQPTAMVAGVLHTLGFAPPGACDAATSDDIFRRRYSQEQARAQAAGHPVTFLFGACGGEIEVYANPKVEVAQVSPAARATLAVAPSPWQQLLASGATFTLFAGLVRSMLKGRLEQPPPGRRGGFLTFVRRRLAPWLATALAVTGGFLLLVKWLDDELLGLRQGEAQFMGGYWPPLVFFWLLLIFKSAMSATWMSLHPHYRDRLRGSYLLRRAGHGTRGSVVPVEDRDLEFSDHVGGPDLVVCGATNLSDDELVPSGRRGAPFLFSAAAVGFDDPNLPPGGACDGHTYAATTRETRISAAIAISGAPLAPVIGRENSDARRFRLFMALFNIRTGVWLPNPYWVASIARGRRAGGIRRVVARLGEATGAPGVVAVLREGMGWTSLMSRSIYVTDGGQMEDLGLVVALRRRPATVYVLDAWGDPENPFSRLAQAMAMARIDSGAEIEELDLTPMHTGADGFAESAWATATIRYADGSTARLVYVKALAPRGLPWDVEGYRRLHPIFPMAATEDQMYDEFDFEAYRELGWFLTKGALDGRSDPEPEPDHEVGMPAPRTPV